MSSEALPIILIEVVLIGGGVLLFGWWQLRSVQRDREKAAADRAARTAATPATPATPAPPADDGTRSAERSADRSVP